MTEVERRIRFLKLLSEINRPGMDKLTAWLTGSDFFTAPASTKYHGAVEGGLLEHSLTVCTAMQGIVKDYGINMPPESVIVCGLLHDVCKVNFYKTSTRNAKNETTGAWEKVPYYEIDDKFPYGHGEKSVYILNEFIHLSVEEAMTIRWHMGLSDSDYAARCALSAAMEKYPTILALQMADQIATFWERK